MMARYTQTGHRDRTSASGVYWATVLVALLLIGAPLSLAQSESSGKASGKWSPSRLFSRLLGATGGQSQPQSAQTWTINYNEDVQSLKAELKKLKEEVASLKRAAATSQTVSEKRAVD